MPDYAALKSETLLPEYSGLSDADAATHYNAKTVFVRVRSVPIAEVLKWGGHGPLDAIDVAQTFTNADPAIQKAVRASAKAAMRMFNGAVTSFDVDDADNLKMVDLFVAEGVFSAADKASLLAKGDTTVPYYAQPDQWGSPVTAAQINHARSLS
jgi:hypothetical protein